MSAHADAVVHLATEDAAEHITRRCELRPDRQWPVETAVWQDDGHLTFAATSDGALAKAMQRWAT